MRYLLLLAVAAGAGILTAAPRAEPPSKAVIASHAEQQLIDNYAKDGPGAAVVIARGDEVLFRGARGMADIEHGTPLTADSLFDIGSITKQFAAAGLLKLVESGKVSLDDPLSNFVKGYPDGDVITVRELLNHTSGIKSYSNLPDPPRAGLTTIELIDAFKNEKPDFAPGASWSYDNSGYVLIGAVIEAASGMPWQAYLKKVLFEPLGLKHTGYGADPAIVARQAHGYMPLDGKSAPAPLLSRDRPYADGALVSTVDDLLKWNRALHEGRVLDGKTYREMITPVGKAAAEQYGFGIWHTTLRNREMIAHSGHISGFSAYLLYLPQSKISVAILQNTDRAAGVVDPTASARELAAFVVGDPYPKAAPVAIDAAALHAAEGTFGVDPPGISDGRIQGARVLRVINGTLTAALTAADRIELVPVAVDTFQFRDRFDRIELQRGVDGAVTAIRVFPWGEGEGVLLERIGNLPALPVAKLADAALERLVGTYAFSGMNLSFTRDGGQLKGQLEGQPTVHLIAESPNDFVVAEIDASVEFAPADGTATTARLKQGGETVEFKRKP